MMRRSPSIVFSLILFFSAPIFIGAQQQEEWYIGKPIKDFTFTGLVTESLNDLMPIVKPYVGKAFSMDLFWEVQGKLFALDAFESMEGDAKAANDEKSEVIVNFVVKERPTVSAIKLVGNREVGEGEILDKVLLKKGDLASIAKVRADEAAIRSLYLEKGYTDIAVTGSLDAGQADNTATISFQISEGAQTTVKEVRFSGNAFASESTLRNLMKTKPPFLFDNGVFQESKLEDDKKALIDYYTDHGYPDAKIEKVDRQLQSESGKNFLILTVYLIEGEQWTYGGLNLEGNAVFSTDRLMELIFQKPGKTLSIPKLKADFQRIVDLYHENGYIFNGFDIKEERDDKTRTITYRMKIVETDKAHIENIIFKGNKTTKDYVLRRELPFEEGDVFNKTKIIDGMRNLYYLQFFNSVQPEPVVGSENGLMNIIYNVEEQSTADIQFGLQFGGETFPISGTLKWGDTNLFGTGRTLNIESVLSPIKQSLSLNYLEPWLFNVRWSVGASLSLSHQTVQNVLQDLLPPVFGDDQTGISAPDPFTSLEEYQAYQTSGKSVAAQYLMSYESINLGIGINSGYRWQVPGGFLGVRGGLSSRFIFLTYDPSLHRPWDVTVRNNLNTWNVIDQLTATVFLDERDNPLSPGSGFQVSQGITYTGGFLFGSRHYNRTDSILEGFLTLLNVPVTDAWNLQLVVAAHSSLSLLLPQFALSVPGWDWTQPITDPTDLVYIDGMSVARGWGQSSGQALWDNKLELRMPISKEALWAVAFCDYAALWHSPSDMFSMISDQFLGSFGIGLRFTITQFPIRIYLGKKFQILQNQGWVWRNGPLGDPNGFNFDFIVSFGGDVF